MGSIDFYFDVGSPYAYLAAERIGTLLPEPVEWRPVLLGGLFRMTGRSSWALGDYRRRQAGMADIERRARAYGLPPMRWPDPWPTDYLTAMRATTFAFAAGRGREFAMQAFRSAFRDGVELGIGAHVLQAGREVGLDARELEAGTRDPAIKRALREATDAAYARGVFGVPTIAIGDALFWGDDRLEEAAAHVRASASAHSSNRAGGPRAPGLA
jgi:2-hydroxychromene-2-carboxylate isomerase